MHFYQQMLKKTMLLYSILCDRVILDKFTLKQVVGDNNSKLTPLTVLVDAIN